MVSRNVRKVLKGDFLVGGGGGAIFYSYGTVAFGQKHDTTNDNISIMCLVLKR